MTDYYAKHLHGDHLFEVYQLADAVVRRYLDAEIAFCRALLPERARVLELGCGYGRVVEALAPSAAKIVGIDVARHSLELAREYTRALDNVEFMEMDATRLEFEPGSFDAVICVQNGICAFREDANQLVAGAMRVVASDGVLVCTSYADALWEPRLRWFRAQAARGLLAPIDEALTGDGLIACVDGFRSGTMRPAQFESIADALGLDVEVTTLPEGAIVAVYRHRTTTPRHQQ